MKVNRFPAHRIINGILYMALTVSILFLFYFIREVFKEKKHPNTFNHRVTYTNSITVTSGRIPTLPG